MRRVRRRAPQGFTLLELIIVIAIFALFSLMAYGGLDSVLTTRRLVETAQDRTTQLQKAYFRLRADLQQVRYRPARDGYGDAQPAFAATDNGYLEFTRSGWRNPLYQPRSSLERVAYRVEKDRLVRMSWRVLDRDQDSAPVEQILLDGVEEVRWRYLDPQRQWRSRWPIEAAGQIDAEVQPPLAAEVTIRTRDVGELRLTFRLGSDRPTIPPVSPSGGLPREPTPPPEP